MNYSGTDIYCDLILSNKLPVKRVFDSENVLAFYHTKPFWEVHIVVVPKVHISSLLTLTDKEHQIFLDLLSAIQKIADDVTKKYGSARVLTNLGEYQDSKHLHFHVSFGKEL